MDKKFGQRVKNLRVRLGLKRKYVAVNCGLSEWWIARIEAGHADQGELNLQALAALAETLNVAVSDLVAPSSDTGPGRVVAQRRPSSLIQHELTFGSADACPSCGLKFLGARCPNGHPNDNT
jgi:transcriptional regulator with XRE-family HTH domain